VTIVLDSCGDGIVWLRHATGPTRESDDHSVAPGVQFGARVPHRGTPRIVDVALGVARALDAEAQLRTADAVVPVSRRAERIGPRLPVALGSTAPPIRRGRRPLTAVMARIAATRESAA
jgi:hypothetical protein